MKRWLSCAHGYEVAHASKARPLTAESYPVIARTGPSTVFSWLSRQPCSILLSREAWSFLMRNRLAVPALALVFVCFVPFAAVAQQPADLLARMQAMEERIKALEAEVQTLKGQPAAAPAPTVAQAPPTAPTELAPPQAPATLGGAGGAASK